MATFYKGDCIQLLKQTPSQSINMIYWNPPFGTTAQWWDEKLDWKVIFTECFRVLKDDGMLVIHCSVPFSYRLIRDAPKEPNHSWYWKKDNATNHLNVKKQPLRIVEEVLVWKNKKGSYYGQKVGDDVRVHTNSPSAYCKKSKTITKTYVGYHVNNFIDMSREIDGFSTRPSEMVELMIKSYTQENDVVLDPTCYKGLTGIVCKKLNRKWIGFDKYFLPSKLICLPRV